MKFRIVPLGDYLKGKEIKVVGGHRVIRRRNGRMVIGCAYCKKTGMDYDGLSICPVCRGKKRNLVREPVVMCAFCKGSGASSRAAACRVCKGKGLVHVEEPVEQCPECHGKGKMTGTDLMCIKCKGKGVIKGKESTVIPKGGFYGSGS